MLIFLLLLKYCEHEVECLCMKSTRIHSVGRMKNVSILTTKALTSLVDGQSFWLLIMRSRVRFPVLPWGFFLEGEDFHDDHGLGSLVVLGFKAPFCTYFQISPPTSSGQRNCASWVSHPQVGYTSATTGRGDHEVHKGRVVAFPPSAQKTKA
jgi:hypothetical protein